jgi:hypothetical protein
MGLHTKSSDLLVHVDSEDYFIVKAELHVTLASDNGKRWEV